MSKEFYTCPKCGSDDISGGQPEYDVNTMWRFTDCLGCGFRWMETYEFSTNYDATGVNEIDEHGNPIQNITLEIPS